MIGNWKEEGWVCITLLHLYWKSQTPNKTRLTAILIWRKPKSIPGFEPGLPDRMPSLYHLRHHHSNIFLLTYILLISQFGSALEYSTAFPNLKRINNYRILSYYLNKSCFEMRRQNEAGLFESAIFFIQEKAPLKLFGCAKPTTFFVSSCSCVRVCECACVQVCVCACVQAWVCVRASMGMRASMCVAVRPTARRAQQRNFGVATKTDF